MEVFLNTEGIRVKELKEAYPEGNMILRTDYPDPDVIRVGDTYYMISTTMHFFPGAPILRSFDLLHWEVLTYVYDKLDDTPAERLDGEKSIYGKGMWAASLRHHNNRFYVCFTAFNNGKTYIFSADNIMGPWQKTELDGCYHDSSLFFDDDGKAYLVYGSREICLLQLRNDLTGPDPYGMREIIVTEQDDVYLGYEGSHFYKINGKYYLFLIHWPKAVGIRTQACYRADSIYGPYTGGDVFSDDLGLNGCGAAQGGIVDTLDGRWFSVLFQDHGAVGRIPVLIPVIWKNGMPVFQAGNRAEEMLEKRPSGNICRIGKLYSSDIFEKGTAGALAIGRNWQWNHAPQITLWSASPEGDLHIRTGKISSNLLHAANTLTQRMMYPECTAEVTVDAAKLKNGDYTGICALQGCYGYIGITRELGRNFLVMQGRRYNGADIGDRSGDYMPAEEYLRVPISNTRMRLRVRADFRSGKDMVYFYYFDHGEYKKAGEQSLVFRLDHFTGCRFGLFLYSTSEAGGETAFSDFRYIYPYE